MIVVRRCLLVARGEVKIAVKEMTRTETYWLRSGLNLKILSFYKEISCCKAAHRISVYTLLSWYATLGMHRNAEGDISVSWIVLFDDLCSLVNVQSCRRRVRCVR